MRHGASNKTFRSEEEMSILDEFEKQCNGFRDSKQFSLADIEKVLGEMKCENCKSYRGYSFSPSECMNLKSAVEYIATPSVNFFCNQFEVKE